VRVCSSVCARIAAERCARRHRSSAAREPRRVVDWGGGATDFFFGPMCAHTPASEFCGARDGETSGVNATRRDRNDMLLVRDDQHQIGQVRKGAKYKHKWHYALLIIFAHAYLRTSYVHPWLWVIIRSITPVSCCPVAFGGVWPAGLGPVHSIPSTRLLL